MVECLGYDMEFWVYELRHRIWYTWRLIQPNPTSIDPDDGEEPEASVPRGTAENQEPETEA